MTANNATPQRLYLLQLSTASIPLGEGRTMEMVSAAYLVAMSDGSYILIDSGVPGDFVPPQQAAPTQNVKNVLAHLAELGLTPQDIDIVITTHYDIDHVGYHASFPQAQFIVQRRQDEVARVGAPRFQSARAHWDAPGLRYRLVEGDVELFPGLKLIESSGHAPGHQSVLVRLPQSGPILLTIDAVVMARLFTPERKAWPMDDNEEELRASTRKLQEIVEAEAVKLVVFGHDGLQWQTLVKASAYYG
jgi:N-acyl homoserine lactone hydrolase